MTFSVRSVVKRIRRPLTILGLTALAVGTIAAFAAAVKFSADLQLGRSGDRAQDADVAHAGPVPDFPGSDYRQAQFPRVSGRPLLGVNYTHHGFHGCSFEGTGILRTYSKPGVARKVHRQLFAMRKAGVTTIRTIVWHMTDARGQTWGPVPSAGGRLEDPYRTNLIRYLREVRRFGFARVTVSFGPQQANNPLVGAYDTAKLLENWRFIQTVRSLLKRHGPRSTRIDLLNEGAPSTAPSDWSPYPAQTAEYLRELYRLYVRRFGSRDVSVSSISWDRTNRVRNLVRTLRSTGQRMPRWFDIHIGYDSAQARRGLNSTDRVLDGYGLRQRLVVGEVAYGNRAIARTIRTFTRRRARRVEEVSPWYVYTAKGCQIPPPYAPGPYELLRRG